MVTLEDIFEGKVPTEIARDPDKLGRLFAMLCEKEPSLRDDPFEEIAWRERVRKNQKGPRANKEELPEMENEKELRRVDEQKAMRREYELAPEYVRESIRRSILKKERQMDRESFVESAKNGPTQSGMLVKGRTLNRLGGFY